MVFVWNAKFLWRVKKTWIAVSNFLLTDINYLYGWIRTCAYVVQLKSCFVDMHMTRRVNYCSETKENRLLNGVGDRFSCQCLSALLVCFSWCTPSASICLVFYSLWQRWRAGALSTEVWRIEQRHMNGKFYSKYW